MAAADIATIAQAIRGDDAQQNMEKEAFSAEGLLYLPKKRGVIKLLPGDWVAVDTQGWPIVVSKYSIANAPWTHNP